MLYEPEYPLAKKLTTYIESDWNGYLDHWGLHIEAEATDASGEAANLHRAFENLAQSIRQCVRSLTVEEEVLDSVRDLFAITSDEEVPRSILIGILDSLAERTVVDDLIKIQLGYELAEELASSAEERISELLSLLALRSLSERTRAYLDRATRLYLWGFDPECVIMCHSVLEAALDERVPDEVVWSHGITKRGRSCSSYHRIQAASAAGVFDAQDRDMAHELRQARNDTVHSAPQISLDAQTAVSRLAKLLDKLFPAPGHGGD